MPAPGAQVGPEGFSALPPAAAPPAEITSALTGAVGGGREWGSLGEGETAARGGKRIKADLRESALHIFILGTQ